MEKIVEDLNQSQERLMAALQKVSQEQLDTMKGKETVGEQLTGLFWHEAYHTGQTGYLRQLAGKNDAVT